MMSFEPRKLSVGYRFSYKEYEEKKNNYWTQWGGALTMNLISTGAVLLLTERCSGDSTSYVVISVIRYQSTPRVT